MIAETFERLADVERKLRIGIPPIGFEKDVHGVVEATFTVCADTLFEQRLCACFGDRFGFVQIGFASACAGGLVGWAAAFAATEEQQLATRTISTKRIAEIEAVTPSQYDAPLP